MKVRRDFVTNSSSSSFLIAKKHLDIDQILAIRHHSWLGEKLGIDCSEEAWFIEENKGYITGSTWMDNFDMGEFLKKIDVDMEKVDWNEYRFNLPDEDLSDKEKMENEDGNNVDWRGLLYEN